MQGSDRSQHTYDPRKTIIGCIFMISCIMFFAQAIVASKTDECQGEPFIPICVLNYGIICACLLLGLCTVSRMQCCNIVCCSVPIVFFCCWFLACNVLLYSQFEPNYNKSTTTAIVYCNKTFYLFAFWSTNLTYTLLGLLFFSFCCCKKLESGGNNEAQTIQVQYYSIITTRQFIVHEF